MRGTSTGLDYTAFDLGLLSTKARRGDVLDAGGCGCLKCEAKDQALGLLSSKRQGQRLCLDACAAECRRLPLIPGRLHRHVLD